MNVRESPLENVAAARGPVVTDRMAVGDFVRIASIAAIFGVIGANFGLVQETLRIVFGFYGAMITAGLWQAPGIVAMALTRKKWTPFVTQNLFGVTQFLVGAPLGLLTLAFTMSEAIGQELVFRLAPRHKWNDWRVWSAAGAVSMLCAHIPNYFFLGLGKMPLWSWLVAILLVSVPSAIILPTLLTLAVVRGIRQTRN
jgi:ABC-type thiamin/hydroxymethylpyrimidine transport system permease subunit